MISVERGQRIPQSFELIAVDGAPAGDAAPRTEILISPGARAEFIINTPPAGAFSQLVSRNYDTGPDGAANPDRVVANILGVSKVPDAKLPVPEAVAPKSVWRFTGLSGVRPVRVRRLYFSEDRADLKTPGAPAKYFITLDGQTPQVFDMGFKHPDIVVRQGTVEDWIIENRHAGPRFPHPPAPLSVTPPRWTGRG